MAEITFAREEGSAKKKAGGERSFSRCAAGIERYCRLAMRAISRASSRVDRVKKEDLPASERNSRNSAGTRRYAVAMRCDALRCSASKRGGVKSDRDTWQWGMPRITRD